MRDLVAGIDTSTQSCTVCLRQLEDGKALDIVRKPHPPTFPPKSEQHPDAWWQALLGCFDEIKSEQKRVAAISTGGQGHGLVMLDDDDQVIRPAKLWNDTESAPDAEILCQKISPREWAETTGSIPGPALTISKAAWIARNEPEAAARTKAVLLPADYLGFKLSGVKATERGGSTGTGYFNPFTNQWDRALAKRAVPAFDWDDVLPKLVPSNAAIGPVNAKELPKLHGASVVVGTGDNMSAAVGVAIQPGDCVISLGTSGTVYGVSEQGVKDASGYINGYADATGRFLPMVTTLNAAKAADRMRTMLDVSTEEFDHLALSANAVACNLVLLPFFDGERTPNLPHATASLTGMTGTTSRADLCCALVEGVLWNLLNGRKLLQKHGVVLDRRLILTGGASQSAAFRQIAADLSGLEVWISPEVEAASMGAATMAASAVLRVSIDELAPQWAPSLQRVASPAPEAAKRRERVFKSYNANFDQLYGAQAS